jgi:nucleoside recognition membrane protein YjiH
MPPAAEAPFAVLNHVTAYWIHLPILIVVVSMVYAGTRYDDWPNILREARRWVVRLLGFLFAVVVVLYLVALLTP